MNGEGIVTDGTFGLTVTMFTYTRDTIIISLKNKKKCSRNFKNYSIQICFYTSASSDSPRTPLELSSSLTPYQRVRRSTTCPVACEHKNQLLVNTRILCLISLSRRGMAPSPFAGRQLYRRENDSIAIRCRTVTWFLRHSLDACYIDVLSPGLSKENPRG
jgi:hypothetical protein